MISILKKGIVTVAKVIHLKLFQHEMSDHMIIFLKNISWSFIGGVIAAFIMFVVNIIAGRILGPIGYGKYSLVIALSSIAVLFLNFGIDASSIYFLSKTDNENDNKKIISTVTYSVLIFTPVFTLLWLLFSPYLANVFSTNKELVIVVIIYTIFLTFKNLFDAYLRGLNLFKKQAKTKIIEAVSVAFVFVFLIKTVAVIDFKIYIASLIFGIVSVYIICSRILSKYLNIRNYSIKTIKHFFPYGLFVFLGGITSTLMFSADKIIANKYLSGREVGYYSAYFTVSMLVMSQLTSIFLNVFFPVLSSYKHDKNNILKKINKYYVVFFTPIFITISVSVRIFINLFGNQYPISWIYIIQFSLLSIINSYFTILWWLIATKGTRGIRFTSLTSVVGGTIFLGFSLIFHNILSISGIVYLLILSIMCLIIMGNLFFKKL